MLKSDRLSGTLIEMDILAPLWSWKSSLSTSASASVPTSGKGMGAEAAAAAARAFSRTAQKASDGVAGNGSGSGGAAGAGWGIVRQIVLGSMMLLSWIGRWIVLWGGMMIQERESLIGLIPFLCRVAAFICVTPFAVCIALDLIAYGIARTLHLSISARRVPRSPIAKDKPVLDAT